MKDLVIQEILKNANGNWAEALELAYDAGFEASTPSPIEGTEGIKEGLRNSYFKETGVNNNGVVVGYAFWLENKIVEYRQFKSLPVAIEGTEGSAMRWVKCSERIPLMTMPAVYIKGYPRFDKGFIYKQWNESQKAFYIEFYEGTIKLTSLKVGNPELEKIFWLDETQTKTSAPISQEYRGMEMKEDEFSYPVADVIDFLDYIHCNGWRSTRNSNTWQKKNQYIITETLLYNYNKNL